MPRYFLICICLLSRLWADYPRFQEYLGHTLETGDGEYRNFLSQIDRAKIKTVFEIGSRNAKDAFELSNFYRCHVFAFECHPESIEICKRNIGLNPNITLVPYGIWDETGERDFFMRVCDENSGASSFFNASRGNSSAYKKVTVQTIRLDEFLKTNLIENIDLLCMDVEGATFQVLLSLGAELQNVKYIITELDHIEVYPGESVFRDVDVFLKKNGFKRFNNPYIFPNGRPGRTEDFLYINTRDFD